MDFEQGFSVSDLSGTVRRRGWLVFWLAGTILMLAVFVASVLPEEYSATATLLVEPQTISSRLVESGLVDRDIGSRLHLISMQILSRGRLSRVIESFGLYEEESNEMTREEVINTMRERISLAPVLRELQGARAQDAEINTFTLSFLHRSPEVAAAVANRLANDFIDEHIKERVEISGDTSEFIENELRRLAQRMDEVESRVAAVKGENTGRLPEDFDANQRKLERTLLFLREAERAAALARSDAAFYRQQARASGARADSNVPGSPARRLESLEVALSEFRSRGLTDRHPDVSSLLEQIVTLEAQVDVETGTRGSPGELSASAEEARATLRAQVAEAEVLRLRNREAELEDRLAATPRIAETLASLERESSHLTKSYQEFSQKRQEANVAADMERRQKGEQFRILEAAYPNPKPVSPNRLLILVLGVVGGLGVGFGAAVLLEAADSSFKSARSLQAQIRIPVLAVIPMVLLDSDRMLRRRRKLRRALATAAVASLMLVASVVGNWTVNGFPGRIDQLISGAEQGAPAQAPIAPGAPADSPAPQG